MCSKLFCKLTKVLVLIFLLNFNGALIFAASPSTTNMDLKVTDVAAGAPSLPMPSAVPTMVTTPTATTNPVANILSTIPNLVPAPPTFDAKAYILIDANSGYVIAEKNSNVRLPPASITKLTSLYIVANALKTGQLHMNDDVTISENSWRMGGSKMFIKVGSKVPVQELINGIVVASGNDATVAMAEHLAGTEAAFVSIMNQTAQNLGMKNSHYSDSNGLPAAEHYSSAQDIATLARAWIATFPEYYPWFKQQWIMFNGIKQPNRNRLLWHDPSVDGMKTGHTDEAGYCLVASAVRNGTRLIAVVLGTPSETARLNDSESLLNYGFRFYETHRLYLANTTLTKARVWLGNDSYVHLGLERDFYATIPAGQYQNLKANLIMDKVITAPFKKGQVFGNVEVTANGKIIAKQPLIALNDVAKAGFVGSLVDRLLMKFSR